MNFSGVSGFLTRLSKKIQREDFFVNVKNPRYSLSVRHPVGLIPTIVTTSFYHTVTLYENERPIERKEVPENLLNYMMITLGRKCGE